MDMKKEAETLEKLILPKALLKDITLTSNYCQKHTYYKNGEERVKPIQMMTIDGREICPRCEAELEDERITAFMQKQHDEEFSNRKHNTLLRKSILTDKTILNATFETYKAADPEEIRNKDLCLEILERLKGGQVFNVFLQGNQGAGKSHLAYSLLLELNEQVNDITCLFVSVEELLRLIKDSFNNKNSKYTEQYFVELLSSVDYLVLDDIGAETGAIDTNKTATDFVQRILYAVTNSRQDKVTISTTNLDSKTLFSMYDKKLVSRLLKNPKYVLFKETKDKRMTNIPF